MNKRFLYSLLLAGALLVSCNQDKVEDVEFDVALRNDMQEIYAGDEITFDFSGNPDISFSIRVRTERSMPTGTVLKWKWNP